MSGRVPKQRIRATIVIAVGLLILIGVAMRLCTNRNNAGDTEKAYEVGDVVDSLDGVYVYYNGRVGNVSGRNLAADGYNLGQKWQCVEFVKRYYYEHLGHKMPETYGHAKDFFDSNIRDGEVNGQRGLKQFFNPGMSRPQVGDLIVFGATDYNQYGHVAIISNVADDGIEIIQQNPGPNAKSRAMFGLSRKNGKWRVENRRVLGWLRKE